MGNGHMDHLVKRQTDIIENITFKELTCWRVVTKDRQTDRHLVRRQTNTIDTLTDKPVALSGRGAAQLGSNRSERGTCAHSDSPSPSNPPIQTQM